MSTPLDITGVPYFTGRKLVACVSFPPGLVAGAGTIVTGGTVAGSTTIATGATAIYLGMTESPTGSGQYSVSADATGTVLPDTTTRPYTREVRETPGATMTSYSSIASAFAASAAEAFTIEPLEYGGGFLAAGVWGKASANSPTDAKLDTALEMIPGNPGAWRLTTGAVGNVVTTGGTAIITNEQAIIES